MDKGSRFRSAIFQMGLALLNATLMLALLLTVTLWMLVGRVQDLATNTRNSLNHALAPQAAQLERIVSGVERIDTSLRSANGSETAELSEEIAALRSGIEGVQAEVQKMRDVGSQEIILSLKQVLGELLAD